MGHRIEAVSDHHMPSGFADYSCVVHEMKLDMVSMLTMRLKMSFTIEGDPASVPNLYREEDWKYHRTSNLLKKTSRNCCFIESARAYLCAPSQ